MKTERIQVAGHMLTEQEQRELLQRVISSNIFAASATLRSFLQYIGENAIEGRFDAIKEQTIGTKVLGRKADYDPAEDNIVRVRARQLRQKLDDYFRNEGGNEPVIIAIPKGHYVPVFQAREKDELGDQNHSAPDLLPLGKTEPSSPVPIKKARNWRFFPVFNLLPWLITAGCVCALTVLLWTHSSSTTSAPTVDQAAKTNIPMGVWAQMFPKRDEEVTVVIADAGFALWQDIMQRELNLGAYLSRNYIQASNSSPGFEEIATRRHTSPTDLMLSLRICEIAKALNGRVRIQFARSMNVHDIGNGNVVLLGSRRSNPWLELYEPSMNFVLSSSADYKGPAFLNRSVKPGEAEFYSMSSPLEILGAESKSTDSYGVAAFFPQPSGHGTVAIFEGLSMEGTEAAGEFVANRDRFAALLQRIGLSSNAPLKPFEVLLKLKAMPGGYANSEIVAYRYGAQ